MEINRNKAELCEKYGFIPLCPGDNEIDLRGKTKKQIREELLEVNKSFIKEADFVIANLNPFRGFEPDSGTCFEVGYASAFEKPVYGYLADNEWSLVSRYAKHNMDNIEYTTDVRGNRLENFDFPLNLMFSKVELKATFEECLKLISERNN